MDGSINPSSHSLNRTSVGRRVKLRTRDRRIRGELVAADASRVQVDETEIPYDEIVRANLIDERV